MQRGIQGQERTLQHGRENEAAQFMVTPLSSAECQVRGGLPQSDPLHNTCVALEPPGRLDAWTPFLHFQRPEVLRSFDQDPPSPPG